MGFENIDSQCRKNKMSGIRFGIGLMARVQEIIFHQLHQWHNF